MDFNFSEKEIEEIMEYYHLWIVFYYEEFIEEIENILRSKND